MVLSCPYFGGRLFLTSKSIGERSCFLRWFLVDCPPPPCWILSNNPFSSSWHASIIGRRPVLLRTQALLRWHGKKAIFFLDSASTAEIESNVAWRLLPRTEWHKQVGTCLLGNTILFYIDRNVRDTIMICIFKVNLTYNPFVAFAYFVVLFTGLLSYYYVTYWILHFENCVYLTSILYWNCPWP